MLQCPQKEKRKKKLILSDNAPLLLGFLVKSYIKK